MNKKQYICPTNEVVQFKTALMEAFHDASVPKDPFTAPARRVEVF